MLRTLKWVYNLGVNHERQRIAAYLQLELRKASTFNSAAMDMLADPSTKKEITAQRKKRLELQIAVNDQTQEIVQGIFQSEGDQWIPGSSFMFPGKEEK